MSSAWNSGRTDGRIVESLPVAFGPDLENNDSRDRTMMMNLKIAAYNGTT